MLAILGTGGAIEIGRGGETRIQDAGDNPIVGIFDPFIRPSELAPGLYRVGDAGDETITIVYADGTSQTMRPTIQSPDDFVRAGESIPGVDEVRVRADGTIEVEFGGGELRLRPRFDVTPGNGSGTVTPSIAPNSNGDFEFINRDGDIQIFDIQ